MVLKHHNYEVNPRDSVLQAPEPDQQDFVMSLFIFNNVTNNIKESKYILTNKFS